MKVSDYLNAGVEVELLYELCEVARNTFGETAVEALVGALSTVVTLKQLQTLVTNWKELELKKQSEYITNHD